MIFYHGTTKDKWVQALKEGMLFGKREGADRCTYLATDIEEAKCYGDVVLTVAYDPTKHPDKNNYVDGCWQFRVYEPICLGQIEDVLYL